MDRVSMRRCDSDVVVLMFLQVTQVITISADLSLEDQCVKTVERTLELLGGLDVLVNNAGYLAKESFTELSMQTIDESMAVNLKSAVKLSQCALASLQRSGGSIVNVSSIAGLRAWPGALAYKMSKAAMDQMTRCVALEVGDIYSYF